MITEFGGGNNAGCFQAVSELIQYMADNDVYIGWAIWAAGPRTFYAQQLNNALRSQPSLGHGIALLRTGHRKS